MANRGPFLALVCSTVVPAIAHFFPMIPRVLHAFNLDRFSDLSNLLCAIREPVFFWHDRTLVRQGLLLRGHIITTS